MVCTRSRSALLSAVPFVLAAMLPASAAWAGQFSVTPVRVYMTPKDRAVAVTVTNESDEPLVMQAELFVWKQKPGGDDDLTPTEDVFLSPPIIKLGPKARQVVRLARVKPGAGNDQLSYRMIVREVPEARPPGAPLQVQVALAFSIPVFITPPSARAKLDCAVERTAENAVNAVCENSGNAHAHPTALSLTSESGQEIAGRDSAGYILPGIKRGFEIKPAKGTIPSGKAKLLVTQVDGSKQTYDVTIPDARSPAR